MKPGRIVSPSSRITRACAGIGTWPSRPTAVIRSPSTSNTPLASGDDPRPSSSVAPTRAIIGTLAILRQGGVELVRQRRGDSCQREPALRRRDQALSPEAVLDRHRIRLLEEQRDQRFESRPQAPRPVMIVLRHPLVYAEEARGIQVR